MKFFLRKFARRTAFMLDRLDLPREMRICDVGARPSSRPIYAGLHEHGGCHLYGFEPDAEAFAELEEKRQERATYFNRAIGKRGKATYHQYPIGTLSSLYRLHEPSVRFMGKERWLQGEVIEHEMSLAGLDAVKGLPGIDLLKMDLQGGELNVLRGGKKTLAEAICIIPEVRFHRMYEDEPMWHDLDRELHKAGFVMHRILPAKYVTLPSRVAHRFDNKKIKSQILDGDVIYIRKLDTPDELPTDQLKFLALTADAVIQSFDLAAHCLDLLEARGAVPAGTTEAYGDLLPDHLLADAGAGG